MKRKVIFIGVVILVLLFGFIANNSRQPTDQDMKLAREYSRGFQNGYLQKQQDLQWQVEAWQKRYLYVLELYENERQQ